MRVDYEFRFDSGRFVEVCVDTDRDEKESDTETPHADWTDLEHCQCANCPLTKATHQYCPAAVDMQSVIEDFRAEPAYQKVDITVKTNDRAYYKHTGLEEGLRSVLGLVMATSHCPLLSELRPMAIHHMPFSTSDEFIFRSVSIYLLQQYFKGKSEGNPDWELKGLIDRNRELQFVNQALWQRIHSACEGDSNLKALLSFFSLASSVTFSLEAQLQKLKGTFESGEWGIDEI